jgi:hypothetical protein
MLHHCRASYRNSTTSGQEKLTALSPTRTATIWFSWFQMVGIQRLGRVCFSVSSPCVSSQAGRHKNSVTSLFPNQINNFYLFACSSAGQYLQSDKKREAQLR